MDGGYELALDQGAEAMVKVSRAILGAEAGGVLFHCHSGTGRTGVLTFVLLALCQVHTHAIDTDFRASLALDEANAPCGSPRRVRADQVAACAGSGCMNGRVSSVLSSSLRSAGSRPSAGR